MQGDGASKLKLRPQIMLSCRIGGNQGVTAGSIMEILPAPRRDLIKKHVPMHDQRAATPEAQHHVSSICIMIARQLDELDTRTRAGSAKSLAQSQPLLKAGMRGARLSEIACDDEEIHIAHPLDEQLGLGSAAAGMAIVEIREDAYTRPSLWRER